MWRSRERTSRKNSRHKKTGTMWKVHGEAAERVGRTLERRIKNILSRMAAKGLIDSFIYHPPHSREDQEGKDFTVIRGELLRSFGVTSSEWAVIEKRAKHSSTPNFYLPSRTTEAKIVRKVLDLFDT